MNEHQAQGIQVVFCCLVLVPYRAGFFFGFLILRIDYKATALVSLLSSLVRFLSSVQGILGLGAHQRQTLSSVMRVLVPERHERRGMTNAARVMRDLDELRKGERVLQYFEGDDGPQSQLDLGTRVS